MNLRSFRIPQFALSFALLSFTAVSWGQTLSTIPPVLPGPPIKPVARYPRIAGLQAKLARAPIFAAYRELAEIYADQGLYDATATTYRAEAVQYRRRGLNDAAIIEDLKAARYDSRLSLFLEREATVAELNPRRSGSLYSGAPLEPFTGCYIGAFIDRDLNLHEKFFDENWQEHRSTQEFAQTIGKPHASVFMYLSYGQKFPAKWIEHCKENNVIPHIAWEPKDLNQVRDDSYLHDFALACRAIDWPIFFRFASEMNGTWTPYHNNPRLYREKFQLVHRVLHQYAPRIATIWCVNNPPLGNIDAYYPGDSSCDWVGVNFYSVPFYENKRNRPAFLDSPLALLDPVYKKYAARKPIAICEYAASHEPAIDRVLRNSFAIEKMSILYSALPRLYPRVKLIDWFNMNTIRFPQPGKTLNDYTLTDQQQIQDTYHRLVVSPYFLSEYQTLGSPRPPLPRPLVNGETVHGAAHFSAYTSLAVPHKIYFQFGSKIVQATDLPGALEVNLDLSRGPFGRQPITVYVYDTKNRFVTMSRAFVNVQR